jgi:hypothetical protein
LKQGILSFTISVKDNTHQETLIPHHTSSMSTPIQSAPNRTYPLSPTIGDIHIKQPSTQHPPPLTPQSPSKAQPPSIMSTSNPLLSSGSIHPETMQTDSPQAMQIDTSTPPDHKRKRSEIDAGEQVTKRINTSSQPRKLVTLADLHQDVGKIYKLCRTRKAPLHPSPRRCVEPALCPAPSFLPIPT